MPELGNRANVMGPQPIARRTPVPPAMLAAAEKILELLAGGNRAGLEALAISSAREEVAALAGSAKPGAYSRKETITHARVNDHYYVKARLSGEATEPLTLQMRLGEKDGSWLIWEAVNLTGRRSGWTQ